MNTRTYTRQCPACGTLTTSVRCPRCGNDTEELDEPTRDPGYTIFDHAQCGHTTHQHHHPHNPHTTHNAVNNTHIVKHVMT